MQQAYMQQTLVAKVQLIKEASILFEKGRDLGFLKTMTGKVFFIFIFILFYFFIYN